MPQIGLRTRLQRAIGLCAAVLISVAASLTLAAPAAQAHTVSDTLKRNSCGWDWYSQSSTGSGLNKAYTKKAYGSCTGHAWLRIKLGGTQGNWAHDADKVEFALYGVFLNVSEHKTCDTCAPSVYKKVTH